MGIHSYCAPVAELFTSSIIVEPVRRMLTSGPFCASLTASRNKDKLIRQLSVSFLQSPTTFCPEVQESVEGYAEMSDDTFARRFHGDRADLGKIGIEIRTISGSEVPRPPRHNSICQKRILAVRRGVHHRRHGPCPWPWPR